MSGARLSPWLERCAVTDARADFEVASEAVYWDTRPGFYSGFCPSCGTELAQPATPATEPPQRGTSSASSADSGEQGPHENG